LVIDAAEAVPGRRYPLGVPDTAHLAAFALAAVTIALIPGPGVLYVLARSLGGGRDAGLRSSYGTGLGGLVHVVAAAAGLSALIAASASAFAVVKVLGAAYLIWLGIRALRSRDPAPALATAADPTASDAFRQGIVTEVLNPKTALFFLTFLPQFCQPDHGPPALQLIVLGTISVALNTLVDVTVAVGAGRISERLRARPELWRRQQIATGGILVGLGIYAAAAGHRATT
jgi:threonine/homoserine/homoserine lactone efflux protein